MLDFSYESKAARRTPACCPRWPQALTQIAAYGA